MLRWRVTREAGARAFSNYRVGTLAALRPDNCQNRRGYESFRAVLSDTLSITA